MQIDYPYHFYYRGRTAQTDGNDHLRDLIEQVIFTTPGERVNRPTFGSGVLGLVFEPNSTALGAMTQMSVQSALQQWLGDLERFRKVFEVSPVAINLTTLKDGKLIEANDAYWELTGFDPKTSLGKTTVELMIWDGEADRQKFVQKLQERRSLHDPSYEFVNENGETRYTVASYELIDFSGGPAILSMFYDVTDQVITQAALKRSEARMRALLEAIPDMIFELDRDGKILQFIPSSTINPHIPPEEFLGKNISQVMPPDVADQTLFAIQRTLKSGMLQVFEYQLPQAR